MAGEARPVKKASERVTIASSAARTVTGNTGATGERMALSEAFGFALDVTVGESTANDTLDVFVQTKVDDNWLDVVHFTQHVGNAGAKRYYSKVTPALATAEFEAGTALSAAAVRNFAGLEWRSRWEITDNSNSASFTFSVTGAPMP